MKTLVNLNKFPPNKKALFIKNGFQTDINEFCKKIIFKNHNKKLNQ